MMTVFAFPVSLICAIAFLGGLLLLVRYHSGSRLCRLLSDWRVIIVLMCVTAAFIAVEGTFGLKLQHNPFFWAVALLLTASSGVACLGTFLHPSDKEAGKKAPSTLSSRLCHLGIFIIMFGAFWGAPDVQDASIKLSRDQAEYLAYTEDGMAVPLPFKLTLKDFRIDFYEDGTSPKQYTSIIDVDGRTVETSVNSPCLVSGWVLYQNSFDKENGSYSVIKAVRDPWYPAVLLGIILLAAGAVFSFSTVWKSRIMLSVIIALAVAFSLISVARINFGTLMPALRSLWFVPHLIIYMLAYSVMAVSLVTGLLSFVMHSRSGSLWNLSFRLLSSASALLIVGMLCGAVWAKSAWGDYWTWDGKECWAAVTWLLTLCGTHFSGHGENITARRRAIWIFILLAFLAIQVTWYGVDYLPSANYSLHTYK